MNSDLGSRSGCTDVTSAWPLIDQRYLGIMNWKLANDQAQEARHVSLTSAPGHRIEDSRYSRLEVQSAQSVDH